MNAVHYPEVLPASSPPGADRPLRKPGWFRSGARALARFPVWLGSWTWRIVIGSVFCFNDLFGVLFNFATSLLVVGWTYRLMQVVALRGWWKNSALAQRQSFADFLQSLGPNAPAVRPRWFFRENIKQALRPETGERSLGTFLSIPWHSAWCNFRIGLQAAVCTYLLTGWGCLLMAASWHFGWLNSFNKGYEQALIGPLTGIIGILVFALAMIYVPMAQAHQAVTGRARSFFDFRFVRKLIQARLLSYLILALAITGVSLPLEVLRFTPMFFYQMKVISERASDAEHLIFFQRYLLFYGMTLFIALTLLRIYSAVIYRSAVLKGLQSGRISRSDLPPVISEWFERMNFRPKPDKRSSGFGKMALATTAWPFRMALYVVLFITWAVFAAKGHVGEFVSYTEMRAFMNHPLVHFPCVNSVPDRLHSH